jgi:hypothetical protein
MEPYVVERKDFMKPKITPQSLKNQNFYIQKITHDAKKNDIIRQRRIANGMESMRVDVTPSQPDYTSDSQNGQEASSQEKEKLITVLVKVNEDDKNGELRPLVLTNQKIKLLQELMGSMILHNGTKLKKNEHNLSKCWECGGIGHKQIECPNFLKKAAFDTSKAYDARNLGKYGKSNYHNNSKRNGFAQPFKSNPKNSNSRRNLSKNDNFASSEKVWKKKEKHDFNNDDKVNQGELIQTED